ncbi:MAG: HlyD family efflux transporter periplasmic adaptor subunit [Bacteroidales bacterium]|nr:HlyD family efflux transporter periplasmic adaptor subunit [Bacteroidales bacterium]
MAKTKRHTNRLELHSEPVRDILGRPPGWLVRSGIGIITAAVVVILIGCRFIKYPEILQATITINAHNLPAQVKARSSGRIDTVFVKDGMRIGEGSPLALIENAADYHDVALLKSSLEAMSRDSVGHFDQNLRLGSIQESYLNYIQAANDFRFFLENDYASVLIASKKEQVKVMEQNLRNQQERLHISTEQLAIVYDRLIADSTMYSEKAIAKMTYQESKKAYMQQQMAHQNLLGEADNLRLSLLQAKQAITELEQSRSEQGHNHRTRLSIARDQMEEQITQWEKSFLLVSPTSGVVAITKYWQKNQNITAGETMMTVVPDGASSYSGKLYLSQRGAGKVKQGQKVNIKLDDYPYMEFGFVQVTLSGISMLPYNDADLGNVYILEVQLPDSLVTQYGTHIPYRPEMTGTAEIITDDMSVLDRLINPIKAVVNR